jgi:hypothetical protein
MPSGGWYLDGTKGLSYMSWSGGVAWKRIKASSRPALQKSFPRLLILDKEEIMVKFNENIIMKCNTMNRGKIFGGLRDMENMWQG